MVVTLAVGLGQRVIGALDLKTKVAMVSLDNAIGLA